MSRAREVERILEEIVAECGEYAVHAGHVPLAAYRAHVRVRTLARRARRILAAGRAAADRVVVTKDNAQRFGEYLRERRPRKSRKIARHAATRLRKKRKRA